MLPGNETVTEGFYWFRYRTYFREKQVWSAWKVVYIYGKAPFMRLDARYSGGDAFAGGTVPSDMEYELQPIEQPGEGSNE